MRRPWIWIIGGRWDRVAALTRLLTALAVLMLYVGYNQAQGRADRNAARIATLVERSGTDTARIRQLEEALRSGSIPIPAVPATTSTTVARRRPARPSSSARPTTTTSVRPPTTYPTTSTTAPCPTATIPLNGSCVTAP